MEHDASTRQAPPILSGRALNVLSTLVTVLDVRYTLLLSFTVFFLYAWRAHGWAAHLDAPAAQYTALHRA